METKLNLIKEIAGKDRKCKLNNLAHLLNEVNLSECFFMLKGGKATGIDGVSLEEYESNLSNNLKDLIDRMKRQAYKPQAVKRVYIPKANGKMRLLGIPTIEDKLVQMCIMRILNAIYEVDFLDMSYGFRPNRSCHDAIDALDKIIMKNPVNHIIDADIKGFFDNVSHEWMVKFLGERIGDFNLIRIIVRFLKAGVMDKELFQETEKGTPQGGVISPILANIYLHYVLDLWIEKVIKKNCRGYVEMVRYADDFVICVQYKEEVEMIMKAMKERLTKFGLELAEDKTRIIGFGRFADKNARNKGKKTETFNFLGFTHYCDKGRSGVFKVGIKTERKKFKAKVKEMNIWLKSIRNKIKLKEIWKIFCAKLRGHFQYFGVSGNYIGISRFYVKCVRLLMKWLNRRSQKKSFNWEKLTKYIKCYNIPKPKIYHNMYTSYGYGLEY